MVTRIYAELLQGRVQMKCICRLGPYPSTCYIEVNRGVNLPIKEVIPVISVVAMQILRGKFLAHVLLLHSVLLS